MTPLQRWVSLFIIALAFLARVWALDYKPAHIDEGVNGSFVDAMRETGHYAYDPANYHGPLHFYVLFVSQTLFRRSLWALRMPTVLIGTATVALLFAFRRYFTFRAVAYAAAFLAISPGMVFYSRYAIHEMWLPFFTLLAAYGGIALARGEGRKGDLWCAGLGVAGMILTKETWLLHAIAASHATLVMWMAAHVAGQAARRPRPAQLFGGEAEAEEVSHEPAFGTGDIVRVALVSYGILIAFYSGFGFYWEGVSGIATTFAPMLEKGGVVTNTAHVGHEAEGHSKEFFYWMKLLLHYEWPAAAGIVAALIVALRRSAFAGLITLAAGVTCAVYLLATAPANATARLDFLLPVLGFDTRTSLALTTAIVGICFFIAAPARHAPARWLALYTLACLAGYTLIPYKTPWCIVNIICPACLLLGHVLDRLSVAANAWLVALIAALLAIPSVRDGWHLNFVQPTEDNLPETETVPLASLLVAGANAPKPAPFYDGDRYAYVQTTFDINKLIVPLRALADRDPRERQNTGHVFGESSPLAWLMNDFPKIQYHGAEDRLARYDADFLIIPASRESEMDAALTGAYLKQPYSPRGGGADSVLYLAIDRFAPVLPSALLAPQKTKTP